MPSFRELEIRRERILDEMRSIRSMKRGTINEQLLPVRLRGVKELVLSVVPNTFFSTTPGQNSQ